MSSETPSRNNGSQPLVIVGGGFAGTTTLLHWLLRAAEDPAVTADNPLRITMLERNPQQMHGGIAYGQTPKFEYNLNLSSRRVTPFAQHARPEGFPAFEEYITELADGAPAFKEELANPSRQLYGLYLQELIERAAAKAGDKVILERTYDEAVDIAETPQGARLHLKSGGVMDCAHVVLATGFKEGVLPKFAFNAAAHPSFLDYPYSDAANRFYDKLLAGPDNAPDKSLLVLGTGLSAMDTVIRLLDSGYEGQITMLSRKAMFHPTYRQYVDKDYLSAGLEGEPRAPESLDLTKSEPAFMTLLRETDDAGRFFKSIPAEFKARHKDGYTSEEILSHWEQYMPEIFAKFPDETNKFLRVNETLINLLRVGTTPEISDKIFGAMERGQVSVVGATIQQIDAGKDGFHVRFVRNDKLGVPKPDAAEERQHFDTVISGIGNSTKFDLPPERIGDPLWRKLRERNAFQSHPLRDGVAVTDDFNLIRGDGTAYKHISAVGSHTSGHLNVAHYPYPEKPGAGARLGAFTLNVQGILGGVLALVDRNYDAVTLKMQQRPELKAGRAPKPAPA